MKIILAGAAGNLGQALTHTLLAEGHTVTALDSNIQPLESVRNQLSGLHKVDVRQPETFSGLMVNAQMLITTIGIGRPRKLSDFHEVDYLGNQNLLLEAKRAGVERFIYTSVMQVESDLSVPLLKAKYRFEQELKQSGLKWLIIRPSGYFTDIWRTFMKQAREGHITLIQTPQPYRFSPIHPMDVAGFVVQNLTLDGESVFLGGPQDFTYQEISELCFEVLNRPAQIKEIPMPIFNILLGFLRLASPSLYSVMRFLRWASTTDLTAPHIGTHTIQDFLIEELRTK